MNESLFPLAADWIVASLSELCSGGDASIKTGPFGSDLHASDYVSDGIPCVMPQDIRAGKISTENVARISPEDHERLKNFQLRIGDIVYPRRGDVVKRALVGVRENGWLCGTGCLRIRPNTSKVDPRFLSFYLAHPEVCAWIENNAVGATMPHLNTGLAGSIPVVVPSLGEQRKIAAVLGAIDDKIEVNKNIATTLEELVRALYRSWFIDFDAVQSKSEGRPPVHMNSITAALFPDKFGNDGLPEGWCRTTIGHVADIVGGATPSTNESTFWDGGTHFWATPKDLSNLGQSVLFQTDRLITDKGLAQIGSGLSPAGTLLLSSRAPIGYLAITQVPVAVNQGFIAIRETAKISSIEAYCWCHENMEAIHANANGSTFQEISKKNFRPLAYILAPEPIRAAFNSKAGMLFAKIAECCAENQTLASLRDTLLPKLMSGEIRVGSTETDDQP